MPIKQPPKPKSLIKTLFKWLAFLFFAFIGTFLIASYFFLVELDKELPDIDQLQHVQYQMPLNIYSQDNLLIAQFGEKRRIPISSEQVPPQLLKAFIAAEDDRFYKHNGVDFKGLIRAASQLAVTGKKRQGGSTITMQVARNFLLSNERTYLRKLKEIILALKIERQYSKDQIMDLYLNKIYMGQRAYGVAAAAQTYYGKDIVELSLAQQAMIAGLPKAPSIYNPITNSQRAIERRNYVLRRMLDLHYINQHDYDLAVQAADNAEIQAINVELQAPYIAEMVRQEVMSKYGETAYTLGLKIYTTIPSQLQLAAEDALQKTLHEYDERHGYRGFPHKNTQINGIQLSGNVIGDARQALITALTDGGVTAKLYDNTQIDIAWKNIQWAKPYPEKNIGTDKAFLKPNDIIWVRQLATDEWALTQIPEAEAAFVAINPNNGAILALCGGFDFYHSKYNRATQSKRQPGSGFKPIVYTAALEKGFTAASIINDAPIVIEDPSQENDWRPENYSHRFLGPTSLRVALRESINLVSVRLLQEIGVSQAIDTAIRFGFDKEQLPGTLSLALGSGYASPLRMASAYAVFANGGFLVKPYLIERIEDHQGNVLLQANPAVACADCPDQTPPPTNRAPRSISAKINFLANSLLRDVVQRGTATQAKQLGRNDLAGKTGTTNEQRDAWFNGFASDIVASAWIGFDNSSPLGHGETGGKVALPMWIKFMKSVQQNFPEKPLTQPNGIVQAYINPDDGLLLDQAAKGGVWEYFSEETVPTATSAPKSEEPTEEEKFAEEALF
ncbi:penicillin-binding protein 1A [Methylomonas albis]|uniref:Penicillin-binding protein 1A n=1 Tax=Methylomonas albis TaxID=1854563 RepID=A0ABR9CUR6_9GAMM|nr:penicillin-binding protein 1A [Methylomonas albis]MBD9354496.1 penicillin-binding protein 1A [Methylomonas albis]